MDSHADTTLAGSNMILLDDISHCPTINVCGFYDHHKPVQNIPIATCATAYDDPDGQVFLLLFGQALYFGDDIKASLLCPNQIRQTGHKVEDTPTQFNPNSDHGITFTNIDQGNSLFIPFEMDGVISFIHTRKPTEIEMEDQNIPFFWATTEDTIWDPNSPHFATNENTAQNRKQNQEKSIIYDTPQYRSRNISAISIAEDGRLFDRVVSNQRIIPVLNAGDTTDSDDFMTLSSTTNLEENFAGLKIPINVFENDPTNDQHTRNNFGAINENEIRAIFATYTGDKKLCAESLAKRWGISNNNPNPHHKHLNNRSTNVAPFRKGAAPSCGLLSTSH